MLKDVEAGVMSAQEIRDRERASEMLRKSKAPELFAWIAENYEGCEVLFPEKKMPVVELQGPWSQWGLLGIGSTEVSHSVSISVGYEKEAFYVDVSGKHKKREDSEEKPGGVLTRRIPNVIMEKGSLLAVLVGTIERRSILNPYNTPIDMEPIRVKAQALEPVK